MSRRFLVPVVLCGLVGSVLFGQEKFEEPLRNSVVDAGAEAEGGNRIANREAKIRAALDEPAQVEFLDTPLREAIDFLSSQHGFPILLDEPSLADKGIASIEPVTRTITDVSLRSALRLILAPLKLTYIIEDEVMKITTREVAAKALRLELYDTRKLQASGIPQEALVRLLQAKVGRGEWEDCGGHGLIETGPHLLMILQTEETHDAIAAMLANISAKAAALNAPQ